MQEKDRFRNQILSYLTPGDLELLRPHLTFEELGLRHRLAEADKAIDRAYFLESGLASVVTNVPHEVPIEVGVIGREGLANLSLVMGTDRSPNETLMQIAGRGYSIEADRLREALARSASLALVAMRFAHVYMIQIGSSVLANGRATVTERLARWLLMAHDRSDGDELGLTHEFLAVMLGVRRSGVTVALKDLQRRGLTTGGRGYVRILERNGLEIAANGYYGVAEAEMRRLFGEPKSLDHTVR